jgi:hypothetical protein
VYSPKKQVSFCDILLSAPQKNHICCFVAKEKLICFSQTKSNSGVYNDKLSTESAQEKTTGAWSQAK